MAVVVVDALEIIAIQHAEGTGMAVLHIGTDFPFAAGAVVNAGEAVSFGNFLQVVLHALFLVNNLAHIEKMRWLAVLVVLGRHQVAPDPAHGLGFVFNGDVRLVLDALGKGVQVGKLKQLPPVVRICIRADVGKHGFPGTASAGEHLAHDVVALYLQEPVRCQVKVIAAVKDGLQPLHDAVELHQLAVGGLQLLVLALQLCLLFLQHGGTLLGGSLGFLQEPLLLVFLLSLQGDVVADNSHDHMAALRVHGNQAGNAVIGICGLVPELCLAVADAEVKSFQEIFAGPVHAALAVGADELQPQKVDGIFDKFIVIAWDSDVLSLQGLQIAAAGELVQQHAGSQVYMVYVVREVHQDALGGVPLVGGDIACRLQLLVHQHPGGNICHHVNDDVFAALQQDILGGNGHVMHRAVCMGNGALNVGCFASTLQNRHGRHILRVIGNDYPLAQRLNGQPPVATVIVDFVQLQGGIVHVEDFQRIAFVGNDACLLHLQHFLVHAVLEHVLLHIVSQLEKGILAFQKLLVQGGKFLVLGEKLPVLLLDGPVMLGGLAAELGNQLIPLLLGKMLLGNIPGRQDDMMGHAALHVHQGNEKVKPAFVVFYPYRHLDAELRRFLVHMVADIFAGYFQLQVSPVRVGNHCCDKGSYSSAVKPVLGKFHGNLAGPADTSEPVMLNVYIKSRHSRPEYGHNCSFREFFGFQFITSVHLNYPY